MTPKERETMQMALGALDSSNPFGWTPESVDKHRRAKEALRAALAQPEQEPWGYISHRSWKMPVFVEADNLEVSGLPFNNPDYTPVYKAPPQREWQGLTDQDYEAMAEKYVTNCYFDTLKYARAIEAKLREKNA